MKTYTQALFLLLLTAIAMATAAPDGGDTLPLPGPGLSYGGIPYGSMSGNVAEFFRRQGPSSGRVANYADVDYAPIEQYL